MFNVLTDIIIVIITSTIRLSSKHTLEFLALILELEGARGS